jgi:cytidylate kinase
MIIAIDGPAGSGKTTVAKRLAKKLNISYLDTGATYRTLTFKVLRDNLNPDDPEILRKVARNLDLKIEKEKVYLEGEDISEKIRTPIIDKNISKIVSYPQVREEMVNLQRALVGNRDFVVEGRDITTVVFPNAEFKFYLDAKLTTRAERRFKELINKGIKVEFEEVRKDLEKRDRADRERKVGALQISEDAVYIDTTDLNIEEVVDVILKHIKKNFEQNKVKTV